MTPEIQNIEDSIKKAHRFGFTPKFKDSFQTKLSKSAFIAIALKTIEKIGWDLVYYDDSNIEAKRKNDWDSWTESITMTYDFGVINIQSASLGNEMWDFGRNSKRVKLFQLVLNQTENELSNEEIKKFESEQKKVDDWEDYVIPDSLPSPISRMKPNLYIPLVSSTLISVLLGFVLAFCISNGFYFIGLFDIGVGFILGFVLSQTLKLGNYTDYKKLRPILIVSLIISFVSCQIFIYQFYVSKNSIVDIDFFSFMKLRFESGLTIKNINTGWIGLLISWGILLFFGYLIGMLKLVSGLVKYQLNRVPPEVLDFAVYLFIKENSEDQVKMELSKLGWSETEHQGYVIEAVGAIGDAQEMRRS